MFSCLEDLLSSFFRRRGFARGMNLISDGHSRKLSQRITGDQTATQNFQTALGGGIQRL
jgi:hypothetical protein